MTADVRPTGDPTTDLAAMLRLEPHGPDTYVGTGPQYPWGGLYGGQIVAQALQAATQTVEPGFWVNSIHAYFIRRGDATEPIRFEVNRVRDGRSFVTRQVIARQAVGAILSLEASFQVDEEAPEVQTAVLPTVPRPGESRDDSWSPMFERRRLHVAEPPGIGRGWLRTRQSLGDDRALNACALAYLSDDFPTDAAVAQHPDRPAPDDPPESFRFVSFSLDHAVWFHRPVHADRWHLHDFTCHGLISSRGLSLGHVFTEDGIHVATITQEVLIRPVRA